MYLRTMAWSCYFFLSLCTSRKSQRVLECLNNRSFSTWMTRNSISLDYKLMLLTQTSNATSKSKKWLPTRSRTKNCKMESRESYVVAIYWNCVGQFLSQHRQCSNHYINNNVFGSQWRPGKQKTKNKRAMYRVCDGYKAIQPITIITNKIDQTNYIAANVSNNETQFIAGNRVESCCCYCCCCCVADWAAYWFSSSSSQWATKQSTSAQFSHRSIRDRKSHNLWYAFSIYWNGHNTRTNCADWRCVAHSVVWQPIVVCAWSIEFPRNRIYPTSTALVIVSSSSSSSSTFFAAFNGTFSHRSRWHRHQRDEKSRATL